MRFIGFLGNRVVVFLFVLSALLPKAGYCNEYLYSANHNAKTIRQIDLATGLSTVIMDSSDGLTSPGEIAVDAFGNLYVANVGNSTILKRSTDGSVSTYISAPSVLPNILGMDFSPNGDLFIIGGTKIYQFNTQTSSLELFDDIMTSFNFNVGEDIEFDKDGNLFVASGINTVGMGAVIKYDISGNGSVFADSLQNPRSLATDTIGNLFVANRVGSVVDQFEIANGNHSLFADLSNKPSDPRGIVTDIKNGIYVLNRNGDIRFWNPDGSGGNVLFNTGYYSECLEYYSDVPEPASLILLATGAIFIARKRKMA